MIIPVSHIAFYYTSCSLYNAHLVTNHDLELGRSGLEVDTLDDGGFQISDGLLQQLSLDLIDLADSVELGNTTLAQLDVDTEVLQVLANLPSDRLGGLGVGFQVDVGRSDDTSLTGECSSENLAGELGTSLSHRQSGGSSTSLGFNDFVTTELNSVHEGVPLGLVGQDRLRNSGLRLRQQGQDGVTGVTTDDGDNVFGSLGGLADDGRDKGRSSQAVQGGDTEQPVRQKVSDSSHDCNTNALLGVEDALLLEYFGKDGDGRVDGVRDDQDERLGGGLRDGLGESGADTSVDLVNRKFSNTLAAGMQNPLR